ncbi:hypothetical protein ACLUEY_15155 [Vreelandella aquamarina]
MKKVTLITAIAITLTSTTVLAERGSGELNEIVNASSSVNYSTEDFHITPADLVLVNGDAAKNAILEPSSETTGNDNQFTLPELLGRNR